MGRILFSDLVGNKQNNKNNGFTHTHYKLRRTLRSSHQTRNIKNSRDFTSSYEPNKGLDGENPASGAALMICVLFTRSLVTNCD